MDLREKFKKGGQKTEEGKREKYKTEEKATTEIEKGHNLWAFVYKVPYLFKIFKFKQLIYIPIIRLNPNLCSSKKQKNTKHD